MAAGFLNRALGTEISIGEINVGFPGTLYLEELTAYDERGNRMIGLDKLDLALSGINRITPSVSFRYVKIEGVDFFIRKYDSVSPGNFQRLLNHFTSQRNDTAKLADKRPWEISVNEISIRNTHFLYENMAEKQKQASIDFMDVELLDMDILASHLKIKGDTIQANFHNMAFIEKSGFELKEFSGIVMFSPTGLTADQLLIQTNNSRMDLDLEFQYAGIEAFSDFINEVKFKGNFRETILEMSDIGYFAETMFSMTNRIEIDGLFSGTVSNAKGQDFSIRYGENTRFDGTVTMNGLPDITETFIHADIDYLTSHANDVQAFALPGDLKQIQVPALLSKTGVVEIKGKFTGFYNDFLANATFRSGLGNLKTDIVLKTDEKKNLLSYTGDLVATNLDAGVLLSAGPQLGKTTFVLEVDGSGVKPESLNLKANGMIRSLNFNGYNYRNITVDGTLNNNVFEGHTSIRDKNLDFVFNGLIDFEEDKPRFDFHSKINHANLYKLQLSNRDSVSVLSTSMNFDFTATSLDDIKGFAVFDSTFYTEGNQQYFMDTLTIESLHHENGLNRLNVFSDFVDLSIHGNYTISNIASSLKSYLETYSENLAEKIQTNQKSDSWQSIGIEIQLKNTEPLTSLFVPQLKISNGAALIGQLNLNEKSADITAQADWIKLSSLNLKDWQLNTTSNAQTINTTVAFDKVLIREPSETDSVGVGIDSLSILTDFYNDSLRYKIRWNDLSNRQVNTGDVEGYLFVGRNDLYSAGLENAKMLFDSANWTVKPGNRIIADTSGLFFSNLNFISDSSMFSVQGGISSNPTDSLTLGFNKLNISHVDQVIPSGIYDVDGIINGGIKLVNLGTNPNFLADIRIDDFYFNKENLGILKLKTNWADSLSKLGVDLEIIRESDSGMNRVVSVLGNYYPSDTTKNFDLDLTMKNLGIRIFNPFIDEYASIDEASQVSGALELSGSYNKPVLTGKVNLAQTRVLIKYLNTEYTVSGISEFNEKDISVNGLTIYDDQRNSAICSGRINHNYFKDFIFDISINHNNLKALNTTFRDNDLFYGKAYATGIVNITGPLDDILMEIQATTESGSQITIPISSSVSVSENDFIIFLTDTDTVAKNLPDYNLNVKGFSMDMELDVTPDAKIDIFLPYGMGDISGYGTGNIGLAVNPVGDFTINGDYRISSGTFTFNFEKLVKREFNIKEGSKISWEGDPYDANVNITATYRAEPTLAGLRLQTDSTAIRNKRVDANCNIHLKNSLFNPDISFSIDLTNVDEDTREIIFAALDTTDQSEMSQQILSLILIGSFSYTTAGPNIGATGFKLLSNQIGNWLSKISKDFDIGINYQPGTRLTEDELKVALRTQLFDDRLLIDGNFGVRGTTESQNTSNVVGDINVEYQITEDGRFRIKAFNRTNDISFLEDNAPYTQGVGVFYRKEFETFRDLFKRNKNKKKKEKNSDRNQQAIMRENKFAE